MKRQLQSSLISFLQQTKKGKEDETKLTYIPLAERRRPQRVEDVIGQENVIGKGTAFYEMIKNDEIHSTILWGPPGCGKRPAAPAPWPGYSPPARRPVPGGTTARAG